MIGEEGKGKGKSRIRTGRKTTKMTRMSYIWERRHTSGTSADRGRRGDGRSGSADLRECTAPLCTALASSLYWCSVPSIAELPWVGARSLLASRRSHATRLQHHGHYTHSDDMEHYDVSLKILMVLSAHPVISLDPDRSNVEQKTPDSASSDPACALSWIVWNGSPVFQSQNVCTRGRVVSLGACWTLQHRKGSTHLTPVVCARVEDAILVD